MQQQNDAITARMAHYFLDFLTKIMAKLRQFRWYLYFSCFSKPRRAFSCMESVSFHEIHQVSVRPSMELVQQGRSSGGASGDIARSPATSMHWERRTFQVKSQLQLCRVSHFAGMPRRLKNHFNIQFLDGWQIRNLALNI
jgi:hypothetical protein